MKKGREVYHHGDLKSEIERIAWETLRKDGAEKLSLRACARAAGVDPAALYRHFSSKDAILLALAGRAFAELATQMEEAEARATGSPHAMLIEIGVAYIRYALKEPRIYDMMFDISGRVDNDQCKGVAQSGRDAYEILEQAWQRAAPDAPSDNNLFALALWSAVHGISGLLQKGLIPNGKENQDALAFSVCEMMVAGCLAKADS